MREKRAKMNSIREWQPSCVEPIKLMIADSWVPATDLRFTTVRSNSLVFFSFNAFSLFFSRRDFCAMDDGHCCFAVLFESLEISCCFFFLNFFCCCFFFVSVFNLDIGYVICIGWWNNVNGRCRGHSGGCNSGAGWHARRRRGLWWQHLCF